MDPVHEIKAGADGSIRLSFFSLRCSTLILGLSCACQVTRDVDLPMIENN